jgi:hypothetical protein
VNANGYVHQTVTVHQLLASARILLEGEWA